MKAGLPFFLAAVLLTPTCAALAQKPKKVMAPIRPTPRPALRSDIRSDVREIPLDLSRALPGKTLATLPSTAQQLQSLSSELKQGQPQLASAKVKSDALAAEAYGSLKAQLAVIAREAADFQALAARVRSLRQNGTPDQSVVFVTAANGGSAGGLAKNSLLEPVVGTVVSGGNTASPGLSYATRAGAQVITPSDGKVLFAGPYHKMGQVLILEITTGYDVVLAGLGRVTVKPNDQLLAGEPVGTMPAQGSDNRLYFELRHGGHGQNPAPWLKLNLRPAVGKANGT